MPLVRLVCTFGILDTLEFLIKSSRVIIIAIVLFLNIEKESVLRVIVFKSDAFA